MDHDEFVQEVGQRYFAATGQILQSDDAISEILATAHDERRSVDACVSEIVRHQQQGEV